jgi:hypothetical protein
VRSRVLKNSTDQYAQEDAEVEYTIQWISQESVRGRNRVSSGESYNSAVVIHCIKIGCSFIHKLGVKIQRLKAGSHVTALARCMYTWSRR